ncbi:hypothetical protein LPJ66_009517 [Kickxella alabastrina]|uniref:Uncharacterized protein n=1 Tax=Kickxella alabastrina TaxID=61397 RepID=A0ACC1I3C2_9FUNG|nr:hypothetical protein LPJ66_009517 [Kickxella alabastrina]
MNNENFSHGYGGYNQQPPQQQFQDYNQQQQFQDYNQQPPQQQQQQGFGGRPDEFNHPPQYGRQSSQYGNEYPADKQNYNYNGDQGENEEGERGIKEFFTKTTVDPYNQEQTEIRTGHVVGAALLTGLVAFGAKKYIDNKKEKQRMQMGNEIGGNGTFYGGDQKNSPYDSQMAPQQQQQQGPPMGNPYGAQQPPAPQGNAYGSHMAPPPAGNPYGNPY